MKDEDQNIQHNNTNQEMDSSLLKHTDNITIVKSESSDTQFDNLPENCLSTTIDNNTEIQFNYENIDKLCEQPTVEQNQASMMEMRIVHITDGNDSKLTMSDLLKSVKMPHVILERITIDGHHVENESPTKSNPSQNILETWFKNDESSVHSSGSNRSEGVKLLKCLYCEKKFAKESQRTLHHKTHTTKKSYKLPFCKPKFLHQSNQILDGRTNSEEKPFKCRFCNKPFSSIKYMKRHERVHTVDRPFNCSLCNARFKWMCNLKRHEKTHTGEKPYKCAFCEKRFNSMVEKENHNRTHTGEKPFECSVCKKKFGHYSTLHNHKRTHTMETPFECSLCKNKFARRSSLKCHHERVHNGEKFVFCEKTFSQRNDKIYHQTSHQKHVPSSNNQFCNQKENSKDANLKHKEEIHSTCPTEFKCSFCKMTFSNDGDKTSHEKIHSREDEILIENLIVGI